MSLFGDGVVSIRPEIGDAVDALSSCLAFYNYKTRKADTGAYNCRAITGGTEYSLHAYGIAIDINWNSNPYGPTLITDMPVAMTNAIKALRTKNGKQVWRWGGDYSGNKDAMHFEITCAPADLLTGIDITTYPRSTPQEDDDMDEADKMIAQATLNETQAVKALLNNMKQWLIPRNISHVVTLSSDPNFGKIVPAGTANSEPVSELWRWSLENILLVRQIPALQGKIDGLMAAVAALSNDTDIDPAALATLVTEAAEAGAKAAFDGATIDLKD